MKQRSDLTAREVELCELCMHEAGHAVNQIRGGRKPQRYHRMALT